VQRIEDYAIIGDCRSAALVSSTGSIDWLAWPRFDSPSMFAAILDDDAGHWSIRPRGSPRPAVTRRHERAQTRFETDTGAIR
jgi:GH15 family glucan-1,4-alpha-glucosidase